MRFADDVEVPVWKIIGLVFLALIVVYVMGFFATGGDLAIYRFWAPKQADAENQVFHHTQAFVDGKNTYIVRLCGEVAQADGAQKVALNSEIVQEASTIEPRELNPDATACVSRAKGY